MGSFILSNIALTESLFSVPLSLKQSPGYHPFQGIKSQLGRSEEMKHHARGHRVGHCFCLYVLTEIGKRFQVVRRTAEQRSGCRQGGRKGT